MTKKIIILFLFLAINSPLYAAWKFNPFTGKQDFYEDVDSIGDTIYLRQDGTKPLTGNWTVGAYAVSTSALLSSTGLIVTTSLQDNALTNCNTVDTDGAGIFKCGTDEGGGGSGDITSVGDVTTGAAFDGTQGTTLTFNNAGGDKTLDYDGTDFLFNAPLSVDATDPADSEALRFDNAEGIAWEASPAGTDITLKVDASEILQASGTFNATTLTEGGTGVPNTGDNLSVFAATTSLQLLGVLSDETGTGAAVFANSPALVTPNLGAVAAGSTWDLADTITALSVYTGTTSLEETTGATDSGGYIVGLFDEFGFSAGTDVQTVMDDLDAAIPDYYQFILLPESATLDDGAPPAITVIESTGTGTARFRVADFDGGSANEIIYWTFIVPDDMASGNWLALVPWFTNTITAGNTVWGCHISATTAGDADTMAEQAVGTENTVVSAVNTTEANRLIQDTITISNLDSVAANDVVTMEFHRDASDTTNDTNATDARLLPVRLGIPRG